MIRNEIIKSYVQFLPGFISTETVKFVLAGAKSFQEIATITLGEIIGKIEQYAVDEAVKAGTDWLVANKIYSATGEFSTKYTSHFGEESTARFQYLVLYNANVVRGTNLTLEFYSADSISPPLESSTGKLPWEKGDWLAKGKKTIDPFVLRVEGRVVKDGSVWSFLSKDLYISVGFPAKVPVLELSPKLIYPLEEQKINFLNKLTTIQEVLESIGGLGFETFDRLAKGVEFVKNAVENLSSVLVQFIPGIGAGISEKVLDTAEDKILNPVEDEAKIAEVAQEESGSVVKSNLSQINQGKVVIAPLPVVALPQVQVVPIEVIPITQENKVVPLEPKEIKIEETPKEAVKESGFCKIDPAANPFIGSVIFNEISWMGTPVSANDEWMELRNTAGDHVNLKGWQILDKDGQISIVFEGAHGILPKGFFLLERTDDDSVPNVFADYIYTGALSNTDEAMYLFDADCVLRDKVFAMTDWPAGDSVIKKSMERDGRSLGWYTYDGQSFGSPRQTNGRDMLVDYNPAVDVGALAGISGGGGPSALLPHSPPPPPRS
ncbi:MAG: lamin tail domain-containing protein [Candidatus Wildermuthbacteria bacterium]|nr:lamin tail domain-containing protein [Candidatus Wildermuthbacteria bacterium]